jgi:hypothetical protein
MNASLLELSSLVSALSLKWHPTGGQPVEAGMCRSMTMVEAYGCRPGRQPYDFWTCQERWLQEGRDVYPRVRRKVRS